MFLIGTSGWHYDDWRGKFYPEKLPKNRWLQYFSQHFSTVEVNATFYRRFKDQTYLNWASQVPPHFRFVLKSPRLVTHRKYLADVEVDIR